MHVHNFLSCVVFVLFSAVFSDEDYAQFRACCIFKGADFEDIEYIITQRFNQKLMMQYNSTRGNWTGFTPYSIEQTKYWNSDPYDALQRAFEKKLLCEDNIQFVQQVVFQLPDVLAAKPIIKLNSVKHQSLLVCSAYSFYPKEIRVTWLRNGQEETAAVTSSEVMSDGEWYYQIHSYLEHIPTAGEKITCMVEHLSLSEPVLQDWDPSLPAPERIQIIVGLCGLMLGVFIVTSGFVYYKKKSAAYFLLCQGQVSIPVEYLPSAEAN